MFTLDNIITLFFLILLQVVLGFDNLLYISLESKKAPPEKRVLVRRWGIGIAIFLRLILLFVIIGLVDSIQGVLFSFNIEGIIYSKFNFHSIIVLVGGIFIIYTAIKEIGHMLIVDKLDHGEANQKSFKSVIFWIVLMNLIFSFDSILSSMALTDIFAIMAIAIIVCGLLMIWLADNVAEFLEKNRMYEVLGLFILFIVGIMLVSEGGHLAHLTLFGQEITPMSKATFYFVISILIIIDIVQSKYQKNLLNKNKS